MTPPADIPGNRAAAGPPGTQQAPPLTLYDLDSRADMLALLREHPGMRRCLPCKLVYGLDVPTVHVLRGAPPPDPWNLGAPAPPEDLRLGQTLMFGACANCAACMAESVAVVETAARLACAAAAPRERGRRERPHGRRGRA